MYEYRFECGAWCFSVHANTAGEAWGKAEQFVADMEDSAVEVPTDREGISHVCVYARLADGLSLVDHDDPYGDAAVL